MKKTNRRAGQKSGKIPRTRTPAKCPKCGGKMEAGACTKCHYSRKTAYSSRREAKEFTYAAD